MFLRFNARAPSLIEAAGATRDRALLRAPQAEWGLAYQGARVMLTRDQGAGWLVRRAGPCLVALGLPLGAPPLRELAGEARAIGLFPFLYKCDASTAQAARRLGWSVRRLGHEAMLDLQGWSLDRPACRQLRRKLRAADKAGLRVEMARDLPLEAMAALSRDWVRRSGGERGFSMGRFDPALLGRQRVVLAWRGTELVAFASFHLHAAEWTLDLMRHSADAPDGSMHRLVAMAIALARAEGAERLSLAAIPAPPPPPGGLWGWGSEGLGQFKRAFGPRLSPRYVAAPRRIGLAVGLAAVAWAVHRPSPLLSDGCRTGPSQKGRTMAVWAQTRFRFEPEPIPCDARGRICADLGPPVAGFGAERFDP